jgi:hypothetical protein
LYERIEKLKEYELKLKKSADDLISLKEFLQFKDLQLRNSKALLEMERKVFQFQKNYDHQSHLPISSYSSSSPIDSSDLVVPPETESFLRTVFHSLDFNQNGLISVQSLLLFFLVEVKEEEKEKEYNNNKNSSTVDFHWNGKNYSSTVMVPLLLKSLNINNLNCNKNNDKNQTILKVFLSKLFQLYEGDAFSDLSWGEILLIFVPFPSATGKQSNFSSLWSPSWPNSRPSMLSRKEPLKNRVAEAGDKQHQFLIRQMTMAELTKTVYEKEVALLKRSSLQAKESAEEQFAQLTNQLKEQNQLFSDFQRNTDRQLHEKNDEIRRLEELAGNQKMYETNKLRTEHEKLQQLNTHLKKDKEFLLKEKCAMDLENKRLCKDLQGIKEEKDERIKFYENELVQEKLNSEKVTLALEERVEALQRELIAATQVSVHYKGKEINGKEQNEIPLNLAEQEEKDVENLENTRQGRESEVERSRRRVVAEDPSYLESSSEHKLDYLSSSIFPVLDSLKRFSQIKNSLEKLIAEFL